MRIRFDHLCKIVGRSSERQLVFGCKGSGFIGGVQGLLVAVKQIRLMTWCKDAATHKANSRLRSSFTSTSTALGYVTTRVSVQGKLGSSFMLSLIRSRAPWI